MIAVERSFEDKLPDFRKGRRMCLRNFIFPEADLTRTNVWQGSYSETGLRRDLRVTGSPKVVILSFPEKDQSRKGQTQGVGSIARKRNGYCSLARRQK